MMHRKGLKRSLAMLLVFVFVFSLAAVQASAADATEPVRVNANGNVGDNSQTYDNVTIAEMEETSPEGQPLPHSPAVIVYAEDGKSAEVTVNEDISANANTGETTGTEGAAVHAVEAGSSASAEVGGDITVQAVNDSFGVRAVAAPVTHEQPGAGAEGGTVQVTVDGNINTTVPGTGDSAHAIGIMTSSANGGNTTVSVGGDVSATSGSDAIGVLSEINVGGTASTSVGGDVSVEGGKDADGIKVYGSGVNTAVSVKGDVSAKANQAEGINAYSGANSNVAVSVAGSVDAQGDEYASGVFAYAAANNADITVSVGKNVTSSSTDRNTGIIGVQVEADNGGNGVVSVGGDVKVEAAGNGNGIAAMVVNSGEATIDIGGSVTAEGANGLGVTAALTNVSDSAKVAVSVDKDVQGMDAGLYVEVTGDQISAALADITVGGTLSAKDEEGAAIMVSEQVTEDNLKLTVWQIDLNATGDAVVEKTGVQDGKLITETNETTKAIEQNINYIIKIEQPNAGATLKAVKKDGSALEKSGDYEVAKEGETVLMKVNVQDGYEVTGAFNGLGEKVELLKDEAGNYFVVVPKGGAVYLSATVKEIQKEDTGYVYIPPAAQNAAKAAEIATAVKAEAEAVKTVEKADATNEKGEIVVVAIGTLDEKTATETMKKDYKNLEERLVDATKALGTNAQAVVPAAIKAEVAEGAAIVVSQPFRSIASEYPATVTIQLDNADSFVGLMAFINGKWVKLDTVINDDGTVTYVLTEPSVLSFVSQQKTA